MLQLHTHITATIKSLDELKSAINEKLIELNNNSLTKAELHSTCLDNNLSCSIYENERTYYNKPELLMAGIPLSLLDTAGKTVTYKTVRIAPKVNTNIRRFANVTVKT